LQKLENIKNQRLNYLMLFKINLCANVFGVSALQWIRFGLQTVWRRVARTKISL